MTLVLLLGLTLLCGLFVVIGIAGTVSPAVRHHDQTAAPIDWSDLHYGFVLLGVITGLVLVLLVALLVDAGQGNLLLQFVEWLR